MNLKLLESFDKEAIGEADIIFVTVDLWEKITRNNQMLQQISLYIYEDIHCLDSVYETLLTRTKGLNRAIYFSMPVATAKDVASWLNIDFDSSCFNYLPSIRSQCDGLGPL